MNEAITKNKICSACGGIEYHTSCCTGAAVPPEPVAWRWRSFMFTREGKGWGDWHYCTAKPQGPAKIDEFQIEPLFAAPVR